MWTRRFLFSLYVYAAYIFFNINPFPFFFLLILTCNSSTSICLWKKKKKVLNKLKFKIISLKSIHSSRFDVKLITKKNSRSRKSTSYTCMAVSSKEHYTYIFLCYPFSTESCHFVYCNNDFGSEWLLLDKRLDRWHSELAQLFDLTETCFSRLKKRRETDFSLWKKGKWLVYSTRNGSSSLCAFKERREAQQFNDVSVPRERKNALERKTFAEPSAKREKLTTFLRLSVLPFYLPPFFFFLFPTDSRRRLWNIFKMAFHTRRARAMWFPLATDLLIDRSEDVFIVSNHYREATYL